VPTVCNVIPVLLFSVFRVCLHPNPMFLSSLLCFQLEITKQVCEDIAMIDFPVVALVLDGSCKSSSLLHSCVSSSIVVQFDTWTEFMVQQLQCCCYSFVSFLLFTLLLMINSSPSFLHSFKVHNRFLSWCHSLVHWSPSAVVFQS
jgi:hypothetical protein